MAFLHASFFSRVLEKEVGVNLLVPEGRSGPFPVFYLLHGLSDDYSAWQRRTRIEWYVRNLPLIVVMPDGFRSFYTDAHAGPAYARYMLEDVLGFIEQTFPVIRRRSGRCIGGLSMGGYGSLRLALARPDLFASATSHSGAFHVISRFPPTVIKEEEVNRIFGSNPAGSAHDLLDWVRKHRRSGARLPRLRLDCGTADARLGENRKFHARLSALGVAHEYEEYPGGHDWDYWDARVQEALAFHARALRLGSPRAPSGGAR